MSCSPPGKGESLLSAASRSFGSWTNPPLDDSEEEENMRSALEQAFAEYRQLEAAPAWLPLLPGGGYWIPPQPSLPAIPPLTPPSTSPWEEAETPEKAASEASATEEPATVRVTIKTLQQERVGYEAAEEVGPKSFSGTLKVNHRHRAGSDEAALASPASADAHGRQNFVGVVLPEASGQAVATGSESAPEQASASLSSSNADVEVVVEFSLPESPSDENVASMLLGDTHFPAWNTVLTQMRLTGTHSRPCFYSSVCQLDVRQQPIGASFGLKLYSHRVSVGFLALCFLRASLLALDLHSHASASPRCLLLFPASVGA